MPKKSLREINRERNEQRLADRLADKEKLKILMSAAAAYARAILKPGDRLCIARCGGIISTVTFMSFHNDWIVSKTLDDIHPVSVLTVNGQPVDFYNQFS